MAKGSSATAERRNGQTDNPVEQAEVHGDVLAWTRHKQKALYELFQQGSGTFIVRGQQEGHTTIWTIAQREAELIIVNAIKKRRTLLTNPLLRNAYVETIDGTLYDTRTDEIVYVGEGNKTEAAAIYRTREGRAYIHMVEADSNTIWPLDEDTLKRAKSSVSFWLNHEPSFRWFLDVMLFDAPMSEWS